MNTKTYDHDTGEQVRSVANMLDNKKKVIKGLHAARRYLEDREYVDMGASPHIDAINDALSLLKEQDEEVEPVEDPNLVKGGWFGREAECCGKCGNQLRLCAKYCDECGTKIKRQSPEEYGKEETPKFARRMLEQLKREDLPEIDDNTEEITINAEDLVEIPDGIEMTHKFDRPIKVKIKNL